MTELLPIRCRHLPGIRGLGWIDSIFDALQVGKSGMVRRATADVRRLASISLLEYECRLRRYRLIVTDQNCFVLCNDGRVQIVC